jgi:hypothetical protein
MNDIFTPFYDNAVFFNYFNYQYLLGAVYDNNDYTKYGLLIIFMPIIFQILFYKLWDPIAYQIHKLIAVSAVYLVGAFFVSNAILYNNNDMLDLIGAYEENSIDPEYFILQMGLITVLYTFISSAIFIFVIKKLSTNNSHNPF